MKNQCAIGRDERRGRLSGDRGEAADRIELVGFIYEHSETFDLMFARHARFVAADGKIHFDE